MRSGAASPSALSVLFLLLGNLKAGTPKLGATPPVSPTGGSTLKASPISSAISLPASVLGSNVSLAASALASSNPSPGLSLPVNSPKIPVIVPAP